MGNNYYRQKLFDTIKPRLSIDTIKINNYFYAGFLKEKSRNPVIINFT